MPSPKPTSSRAASVVDPNTGKDFVATRSARNIKVARRRRRASTSSSAIPAKSQHEPIRRKLVAERCEAAGRGAASRSTSPPKVVSHAVQRGVKLDSGRQEHRRGRLRQGRRRQVDDRGQPRARARGGRRDGRRARRGHLRPVAADDARHRRPAGVEGRQDARADGRPRRAGDVDRLPDRRRHADGVARPDGDAGARAAPQGHATGASSTTSSSTCRPAPATSSSRSRRRCRSPARSS